MSLISEHFRACTHSDYGVCALTQLRLLKTNALVFYALKRQIKFPSKQHSLQTCKMHDGPLEDTMDGS